MSLKAKLVMQVLDLGDGHWFDVDDQFIDMAEFSDIATAINEADMKATMWLTERPTHGFKARRVKYTIEGTSPAFGTRFVKLHGG